MINCRETSVLISRSMDHSLSFVERWSLKLHILICGVCHAYESQLRRMRAWIRAWEADMAARSTDLRLSQEARERIKLALRNR